MADTEKGYTIREWMDADKFLGNCKKLQSLGRIVGFMGYGANGEELLQLAGQQFGSIICDYAEELAEAASELYPILSDFFEYGGVSLVDRAKALKEGLDSNPEACYTFQLTRTIEMIDQFLNNDLKGLVDLRRDFQNVIEKRAKEGENER